MKPVIPYPERPYIATHVVTFESGYKRDLVPYGAKCEECRSHKTFLAGGNAACAKHLTPMCEHGSVACGRCGFIKPGMKICKLHTPRQAR